MNLKNINQLLYLRREICMNLRKNVYDVLYQYAD